MKAYLKELLPRIQRHSQRLDNLALLTDQPWVELNESGDRILYIFRSDNNELLVSKNGDVSTCTWDYLEYASALLIEIDGKRRLYKQGFVDSAVLVLKQDGQESFLFLANENKIEEPSLEVVQGWLEARYLPVLEGEKNSIQQSQPVRSAATAQDRAVGLLVLMLMILALFGIAILWTG